MIYKILFISSNWFKIGIQVVKQTAYVECDKMEKAKDWADRISEKHNLLLFSCRPIKIVKLEKNDDFRNQKNV